MSETVTMAEAREILGVEKVTLGKIVRREHLRVYRNPLDARERRLLLADVERLKVHVAVGA